MWPKGERIPSIEVVAKPAARIAELAGIELAPDRTFLIVEEDGVGAAHPFSGEKLSVVLALYHYQRGVSTVRSTSSTELLHIRLLATPAASTAVALRSPFVAGQAAPAALPLWSRPGQSLPSAPQPAAGPEVGLPVAAVERRSIDSPISGRCYGWIAEKTKRRPQKNA
jgi:hypothetical protein